jgi:AcrR family transcriptional regulator
MSVKAASRTRRSKDSAVPGRVQDPEGVKRNILAVATAMFAEKGYSGSRVDEIARKTETSKRMIYYYFKDKEGLFLAVLEEAYAGIRSIEHDLDLAGLSPVDALRKMVEFTFDYQNGHPDFVRLVIIENIHHAENLKRSQRIQNLNVSVIAMLEALYRRGVAEGVFRDGIDVIDLHMSISALSFFNVSNRYTFSYVFKRDMVSPEALAGRRAVASETILRFVMK